MFIKNGKRFNIYAPFTDADNNRHANALDPSVRERFGVTEVADPVPPTPPEGFSIDEAFYRTEQDDAPYVVWTPKSETQLAQISNAKIQAKIVAIENGQARAVREAALGDATHLTAINAEIEALRATLKVIPAEPVVP